ncbi:beta-1,3-galactosyltransferase bre-5-like [Hyalella azteca]|uniref:Hexosyltransferase n=1 Tax=Hyalella azteca TaxID=294128 RepID=A0A8B7N159_HYAAZ|nr:beta-1,3-galactosyltransferase bre-5-like [Hyalella azteca]
MMYRAWCRGRRPCVVTLLLVLSVNIFYRTLLLLESRGALARNGINLSLPKIGISFRRPLTARVPLRFLVEERSYCSRQPGLLAVAVVPSALDDFKRRQETRLTWGSAQTLGVPLGAVFVMGKHRDRDERDRIRQESRLYRDIVQGDYDDTQGSSKALNGLLWMAMNCATVPFTLHVTDKVLLDVFVLQRFLWEVLEAPEKQDMLFGKLVDHVTQDPVTSYRWSLSDFGHMVPEVTEPPAVTHGRYLEEDAWFGRTQAVAKLLTVSGVVPLVSPSSLYLTGMLARAAGLSLSPSLFNEWWRSDKKANLQEIGAVMGWFNKELDPPRSELWKQIVLHHTNETIDEAIRDVKSKNEQLKRKELLAKSTIKSSKNFITNHIPNHFKVSKMNPDRFKPVMSRQGHIIGHGSEMKRSASEGIL